MPEPQQFGRYLLVERICTGGMAEVFLAKATGAAGFHKIVAIKRILPWASEETEFTTMFIDEARISARLSHVNIAQVFEFGQVSGLYFLAMEYIPGKDMRAVHLHLAAQSRAMPVPAVLHIGARLCQALDYAHRLKNDDGSSMEIVHRDVSPPNVIVSYDGAVKLIDFGIAKAAARSTRTRAGRLKGKLAYMAPEQVRGLPVDHRCDIFSLGVLLYEVLTGRPLFHGPSQIATLELVRRAEVAPPSAVNPEVPIEVDRILLSALAREPEERYAWASEMRADIERCMARCGAVCEPHHLAEWMRSEFAADMEAESRLREWAHYLPTGQQAEEGPGVVSNRASAPPQLASNGADRNIDSVGVSSLSGEPRTGGPRRRPTRHLPAKTSIESPSAKDKIVQLAQPGLPAVCGGQPLSTQSRTEVMSDGGAATVLPYEDPPPLLPDARHSSSPAGGRARRQPDADEEWEETLAWTGSGYLGPAAARPGGAQDDHAQERASIDGDLEADIAAALDADLTADLDPDEEMDTLCETSARGEDGEESPDELAATLLDVPAQVVEAARRAALEARAVANVPRTTRPSGPISPGADRSRQTAGGALEVDCKRHQLQPAVCGAGVSLEGLGLRRQPTPAALAGAGAAADRPRGGWPVPPPPTRGGAAPSARGHVSLPGSGTGVAEAGARGRLSSTKVIVLAAGVTLLSTAATLIIFVLGGGESKVGRHEAAAGAGTIVVTTSQPAACTVSLDGTAKGLLSPGTSISLSGVVPGPHSIAVTCVGFHPFSAAVKVNAAKVTLVEAELKKE